MSDEETVKQVKRAVGIVEKAEVPTDLRAAVYESVWRTISGAETGSGLPPKLPTSTPPLAESEGLGGLANKLDLGAELIGEIFEEDDDGSLTPHIPTSKLSGTKADVTKEITLLVCAADQQDGTSWTNAEVIRTVGKEYANFDAHNFAQITKDNDDLWRSQGSGVKREIKLRRDGWEAAKALIQRIVTG